MIQFIKFLLVGILNTAFGVGLYCLFIWFGCSYGVATLLGTILGVLWNFKTTGTLVFRSHDNRLIFRFIGCYTSTYMLNVGLIALIKTVGLNDYLAGIVAMPVMAVVSFFLLRRIVFR